MDMFSNHRVCEVRRQRRTHAHVDGEQCGEYLAHGGVREGVNGDDVEVSDEAGRDLLPTAARRSHGTQELHVLQQDLGAVLPVVPGAAQSTERDYNRDGAKLGRNVSA